MRFLGGHMCVSNSIFHLCRLLRGVGFAVASVLLSVFGAGSVSYAASPSHGAEIFQRHCVSCHGESGEGVMPGVPNFKRGEGLMQPDRVLAEHIRMGKMVMPAFQGLLREEEIYDVIAYLRTLQ